MGRLKQLAVGLGALVAVAVVGVSVAAATRPDSFRIERSAEVPLAPEAAFAQVNDFRRWSAWSPWEKLDPAMQRTHSGAEAGVGAAYAWVGNDQVGSGNMTITESQPPSRIVLRLEFVKPWQAVNTTTFTFQPSGAGTRVTWAMDGTNTFGGKVFSLFMDMDALVGADFEKGLAAMGQASTAR